MKTKKQLGLHLIAFFLERELLQTKVIEEIKSQIHVQLFYFLKLCLLWDNVEKYCNAGQATDDNVEHARWKMDT